jgi:hypothetical protein
MMKNNAEDQYGDFVDGDPNRIHIKQPTHHRIVDFSRKPRNDRMEFKNLMSPMSSRSLLSSSHHPRDNKNDEKTLISPPLPLQLSTSSIQSPSRVPYLPGYQNGNNNNNPLSKSSGVRFAHSHSEHGHPVHNSRGGQGKNQNNPPPPLNL